VDGQAIAESKAAADRYAEVPARLQQSTALFGEVTGYFTLNQGTTGVEGALNTTSAAP
jgi:hypothetical protein